MDNKQTTVNNRLYRAASYGDISEVKTMLENGADHTYVGETGTTPLMIAARNGGVNIIEVFHTVGKLDNINAQDRCGQTALHYAAGRGHVEVVRKLLEYGADSTLTDKRNHTALMHAAKNGHEAVIEASHGAGKLQNINAVGVYDGTALHLAALKGHTEIVKKLLEYGADIRVVGKEGETALMMAVLHGCEAVIEALHEVGKLDNINVQDYWGRTALHIATLRGHVEIVMMLISYGADPTLKDRKGRSTVDLIVQYRNKHDILIKKIEEWVCPQMTA